MDSHTTNDHNNSLNESHSNSNNHSHNEQQRRNKKRKPPNYYQSAEYAALIKHSDELAQQQQLSNKNINSNSSSIDLSSNSSSNNCVPEKITTEKEPQTEPTPNNLNQNKVPNETTKKSPENEENASQVEKTAQEFNKLSIDNNSSSATSSNSTTANTANATTSTSSRPTWGAGPKNWSSLFQNANNTANTSSNISSSTQLNKPQSQKNSNTLVTAATNTNVTSVTSSSTTYSPTSTTEISPDILKNLDTLFKETQLKHSAPALQPKGIRNTRNWCYINATLQALLACPPFYNLIKTVYSKLKSSSNLNSNSAVPFITALGRFTHEFKSMVRSKADDKSASSVVSNQNGKGQRVDLVIGETLDLQYFYDVLNQQLNSKETFKYGRQEDAQEFLSFLLNRLHEEMLKCLHLSNSISQQQHQQLNNNEHLNGDHDQLKQAGSLQNNDDLNNDSDEWKEVGKKNRAYVTRKAEFKQTPLSDIFCGQFRSALSAPGVKDKESVSFEPFFTIPLEIQVCFFQIINFYKNT